MNKQLGMAVTALGLFALTGTAQAVLDAVDPGPYTAATGHFPLWYQDANGMQLELCRSKATLGGAGNYLCTLLPEPGVFDDTLPLVFPDNWPPELFWFLAEATIPNVGNFGMDAYVAGVEAAFANEEPINGDQQAFARIRIRVNVPQAGTYIITHPYGEETATVTPAQFLANGGRRAINITRDIGIAAPGNFTDALNGDIGPFLTRVGGNITIPSPDDPLETEIFIGNPNVLEQVTGSPNDTNFVRIVGPNGISIETDLFSLSGKLVDPRPSTPLAIERSTYSRTSEGTRIAVFASSLTPGAEGNPPTPSGASLCYRETVELVPGTTPSPCLAELIGDNNGYYYADVVAQAGLPEVLVVTASDPSGTTKSTPVSSKLNDVVKITNATYSWADQRLTIEANSSDEVEIPDLAADGFGRLNKSGTNQTLTISDLEQPPAFITIKSAAGGSDTEPVTVVGVAPEIVPNQLPVAIDDTATTSAGVPVTINPLANDSDPDNDTPLTLFDIGPLSPAPAQGSIARSGTSVVYTPPAVVNGAPLVETFTYVVQDTRGGQATGTVTVTTAANQAPTAVNDTAAASTAPITIPVTANDTDPEGNLPLIVAPGSLSAVAGGGSVAISPDGTGVIYTPPATVTSAFNATFSYRVQDSLGAVSANEATVSVAVTPPPVVTENLTVTTAEVRVRSGGRYRWDLQGQTSQATGNTITVTVTTTAGPLNLGTATLTATGRWRMSVDTTGAGPTANPTATVTSAFGQVTTVPLTVR